MTAPGPAGPGPWTGDAEVVIATVMRRDSTSGVQTHVEHVAALLASTASEPDVVVTPFTSHAPMLRPVFALRLLVQPVSGAGGVWWYRHWHAHYLAVALRRRLRHASPTATVYAQCPVSAAVALRVRRPGQRVVMAVHFNGSQADEWAEKGLIAPGGWLFRAIRRLEAETLPQVDGIVYVSDYMRRVLQARIPALRAVPAVVIPNFLASGGRPASAASGGPDEPDGSGGDLVSVGSLEPRKNQRFLLEVLRAATDRGHPYRLTLVGDGPQRRDLERGARDLGVADRVTFLGYRANARTLLAGHRVYCHAALVENLPFAVVEAMSEGLPVIAGAVGGIPEMVRGGVDGDFWPLDDPDDAATVLIRLLEDEPRRRAMSASARERARRRYSGAGAGERLLRFLTHAPAAAGYCPGMDGADRSRDGADADRPDAPVARAVRPVLDDGDEARGRAAPVGDR